MSEHTTDPDADIELLPVWEGDVQHAPGVLFEVAQGEGDFAGEIVLADLAGWVALTALSGVIGNSAYDAIKSKVLNFLKSWRRQEGQAKVDELKEQVRTQMLQRRAHGKLTEDQLNTRIDEFFDEIQR